MERNFRNRQPCSLLLLLRVFSCCFAKKNFCWLGHSVLLSHPRELRFAQKKFHFAYEKKRMRIWLFNRFREVVNDELKTTRQGYFCLRVSFYFGRKKRVKTDFYFAFDKSTQTQRLKVSTLDGEGSSMWKSREVLFDFTASIKKLCVSFPQQPPKKSKSTLMAETEEKATPKCFDNKERVPVASSHV